MNNINKIIENRSTYEEYSNIICAINLDHKFKVKYCDVSTLHKVCDYCSLNFGNTVSGVCKR